MKTMTKNPMTTTAKEIKATNALKTAAGNHLRAALTLDERSALGVTFAQLGTDAPGTTFDALVETLRTLARTRIAEQRAAASSRSPLISARYADTLARGIVDLFTRCGPRRAQYDANEALPTADKLKPWASVSKDVLHANYMAGSIPRLAEHDAHPGSRAGTIVVDLRDAMAFATAKGVTTPHSISERVNGSPSPTPSPTLITPKG